MSQIKLVEPTKEELHIRIIELESDLKIKDYDILILRTRNRNLEAIIKQEPIITEEQYLTTIHRLQYILQHYRKRLITEKHKLQCSFCGAVKPRMTMWYNTETKEFLMLCFHGCQNFPEPFRETKAGSNGKWLRIDPWQEYKKTLPRLRKHKMGKPPWMDGQKSLKAFEE